MVPAASTPKEDTEGMTPGALLAAAEVAEATTEAVREAELAEPLAVVAAPV